MSLQRQFQSTSIPDDLPLMNDLNEASSDDRWITSNESFASDWMSDDAENKRRNQNSSKDALPRVVARMPNLKPSLSLEDRSQHLGKIFFDLFASRNRRWVGTLVVLVLIGLGFGLWSGRTSKVAPTGFAESDELETTIVVHSEPPISPKNKLASLTSNAIKSLSDDQNSIPADGSFPFEANDGVLTAFHYEPAEPSSSGYQSVYAARDDDGSSIPETANPAFPEKFDRPSNRFENYDRFSVNETNQNGSWERSRDFRSADENSNYGIPTNYSSPNSYNSFSNIPVNWDDLNDETRSSQPENSNQSVGFYSNEPLKNDIQHFKPVQRNASDIRFDSEQNFNGQNYRSVARPSDFNGNGYSNGSPFAQNQNVAVQNDALNYSNAGVYENGPNSPNARASFNGSVPNNYGSTQDDRRSSVPNVLFQNFVPQNGAANQTGLDGRSGANGNVGGDGYSRQNPASMNYSSSDQGYSPNNLR